jgi:hypothetical protein
MGLNAANGVNPRFIFAPKVRRKIALSGTTAVNNSTTVIGSGTTFLTDLIVGDYIMLGPRFTNTPVRVESITSNTQLTVASPIGDGTTKKIIRVQNFDRPFDLHITRNDASVAVNPPVSVVSVDFDGTARPQGILPEMGAYEYSGQLSVIQSPTGVRISP